MSSQQSWDQPGGKLLACLVYVAKVACLASYYWLGTPPRGNTLRGGPRGIHDLLLGSTGSGRPCLYPASVFPTLFSLPFIFLGR